MSEEEGSKLKGIVLLWPLLVVAAYVIFCSSNKGMREVEVQPAPRMSRSTGVLGEVEADKDEDGGVEGAVSCVIGLIWRSGGGPVCSKLASCKDQDR